MKRWMLRAAPLVLLLALAACAAQEGGSSEDIQTRGLAAGVPEGYYRAVAWIATGIEAAGIAVIVLGLLLGIYYAASGLLRGEDATRLYSEFREQVGRAILLGLEFLVAADIIGTVAVEPNFENLAVLGLIVLIRTFLSFALEAEIHGRWPWQGSSSGNTESSNS